MAWAIVLTVWVVGCAGVWWCDPDRDAPKRERAIIALTWFLWAILFAVIAAAALAGAFVRRIRRNAMTRYYKG